MEIGLNAESKADAESENDANQSIPSDEEFVPSDYSEMDSFESDDENQNYDKTDENCDAPKSNLYLCDLKKILELVKFCPRCGNAIENMEANQQGSMLLLHLKCIKNCGVKWCPGYVAKFKNTNWKCRYNMCYIGDGQYIFHNKGNSGRCKHWFIFKANFL